MRVPLANAQHTGGMLTATLFPAVVDNLPQVPPEKQDKLIGVLRKLYDNFGTIREGTLSGKLYPAAPL